MTENLTRHPARRSPWRIWILGVGILLAIRLAGDFVPLMSSTGWLWTTRMAEFWLVSGLMVWAWKGAPLSDMLEGIGRGKSVVVGLLLLGVVAGQYVGPGSRIYPLFHWDMYTSGADQVTYGEVWLVDAAGARQRLQLSAHGVTAEPRAVSGRLLREAEAAAGGDSDAQRLLRETLLGLAGSQAANRTAEIYRCVVIQPTPKDPAHCEVVHSVDLEPS